MTPTKTPTPRLRRVRREAEEELRENILGYWLTHAVDRDGSGFHGRLTYDNRLDPTAPRSAVLNTRILWTFSVAAEHFGETDYREAAERAYVYLRDHFIDREHGGVYWSVDHTGAPLDQKNQVYALAFAIMALADYYRMSGREEASRMARSIFDLVERYARDREKGGYFEAYSRDWKPSADQRISPRGLNTRKTMNTHLHVLEAYTVLLSATGDETVREALTSITDEFLTHILSPDQRHLLLFFDEEWRSQSDIVSYGHDIEASWLLDEAGQLLDDSDLRRRIRHATLSLAEATLQEAVGEDGGIANELHGDGTLDTDRHWWPQAEALVGFLNAWQITGDSRYEDAVVRMWDFIRSRLVDQEHGEWFSRVDIQGRPNLSDDKVGPWKGPYHNGRACLEVMKRVSE
jgi:cellobiose epimerase